MRSARPLHVGQQLTAKPTYVILNAVPARSAIADKAEATLAGKVVAPVRLGHRADFVSPLSAG